jgi:hypothetical protein
MTDDWELEQEGNMGVLRAAQRKLWHELGIVSADVPLDKFNFITRIHYKSLDGSADGIWGEHESTCLTLSFRLSTNNLTSDASLPLCVYSRLHPVHHRQHLCGAPRERSVGLPLRDQGT